MIPMRTKTIFKSRWMALIWAAGIIWFALDVAGTQAAPSAKPQAGDSGLTDANGQPLNEEQAEQFEAALNRF